MAPKISNNQGSNPLEKDRQSTDKPFIFVYLFIFILWLAVGIPALLHDHIDDSDDSFEFMRILRRFQWIINAPAREFRAELLISLFTSTGFVYFVIFLIMKFTKFFIWIAIILNVLSICTTGYVLISLTIQAKDVHMAFLMVVVGFFRDIIFMIVFLASSYKIGLNATRDIIQDSCGVILSCHSLIPFFIGIIILEYLVILFSTNALIYDLSSGREGYLIAFSSLVHVCGGIIMLQIISNLVSTTFFEHTVNRYWNHGEQHQIKHSIALIWRYHIGTIVFSSILPISWICAIFQAFKHKRPSENRENNFVYFLSKVLLTLRMPSNALIFTSIYGTGFVRSSKKTFDAVLHHCILYFITTWVLEEIFSVISIHSSVGRFMALQALLNKSSEEALMWSFILGGSLLPVYFIGSLMSVSAKALLMNQIIILNNGD